VILASVVGQSANDAGNAGVMNVVVDVMSWRDFVVDMLNKNVLKPVAVAPMPQLGFCWRIVQSKCLSRFDRKLVGRLGLVVERHTSTATMQLFHADAYDVFIPNVGIRALCISCLEPISRRDSSA